MTDVPTGFTVWQVPDDAQNVYDRGFWAWKHNWIADLDGIEHSRDEAVQACREVFGGRWQWADCSGTGSVGTWEGVAHPVCLHPIGWTDLDRVRMGEPLCTAADAEEAARG